MGLLRTPHNRVFAGRHSLDNTPVTGSLLFAACGCRLAALITERLVWCVFRSSAELELDIPWSVSEAYVDLYRTMRMLGRGEGGEGGDVPGGGGDALESSRTGSGSSQNPT